jgi:hypothetical protein
MRHFRDPSCVPNPKCQGPRKSLIILRTADVAESIDEAKILKDSGVRKFIYAFPHEARCARAELMVRDYDILPKASVILAIPDFFFW